MVRYIRPPWLLTKVINPLVMRFGSATTLAVPTRGTGKAQRLPVNVLELDGHRYLVAVRGETQWVRNLRAAGSCELCHRGWVQRFSAVEVPADERAALVEAYRARWRRFLADVPDHPVFELLPC